MKLDTKNLKKIHEDEHCTTLAHKSGHKILIAHKALSKATKKQLDEIHHYSEGGYVEDKDRIVKDEKPKQEERKVSTKQGQKTYDQAMHDLTVKQYADGGEVEDIDFTDLPSISQASFIPPEQAQQVDTRTQSEQALANEATAAQAGQLPQFQAEQSMLAPMASFDPGPVSNPPMQAPMQAPQAPAQDSYQGPVGQYDRAMRGEAQAIGAQGKQEMQAQQAHMHEMAKIEANFMQQNQAIMAERAKVQQDLQQGHIDPKHFWASKSTGEKIFTAIGLILGGMGAQATGGRNVVLDMIEKRIDQDIDAQKTEMGKKQNLVSALTQQLGDVKEAATMAKMFKLDQLQTQFQQAASQAKDPLAKQRAEQAIAMLNIKLAPYQQQMAARQTMKSMPPEQAVQFLPKEQQGPAREALQKWNEFESAKQSMMSGIDQQKQMQSTKNRIMNPIQSKESIDAVRLRSFPMAKKIFNNLSETDKQTFSNAMDVGYMTSADSAKEKKRTVESMVGSEQNALAQTLRGFGITVQSKGGGFTPRNK